MAVIAREVKKYMNRPQLLCCAANCRVLAVKMARRLGKTEVILAYRALRALIMLIGSSGFFASKSHAKQLDHTLPGVIKGWSDLGFIEDRDYVIGKVPPKHFKRPLMPPKRYDNYISTAMGSGIHLISMDHASTANGLTTDWGCLDEYKQYDPERVKAELFKTMNGHRSIRINHNTTWGDLPEHLSLTVLTDAYIGKHDFKGIDDFKKDSISEQELCELLMLIDEFQKTGDKALERYIWEIQREATLYMEAGAEENLAALGLDYFKQQEKNSNPIELRTSLFNEDVKEIAGGFYPLLDEPVHTYSASNYSRIDDIGISNYLKKKKDCEFDLDCKRGIALKLDIDYGSEHSWCTVKQKYSNTYWTLKNFWSTSPKNFVDMIHEFCDYYERHRLTCKIVELYDDPAGHKLNTDQKKDIDAVISALHKRGWDVRHKNPRNKYIPHRLKYRVWEKVLDERPNRDQRFPKYRHNINNAYQSYYSMSKAPVKLSSKGEFEKDKSSERDKTLVQWKATHLSDCSDMSVCYDLVDLLDGGSKFSSGM